MWNWLGHLRTIHHHKMLVMRGCFALGLYRQGLMHDLSKYSPTEFLVGARYYTGVRSPNDGERRDRGYSLAWLHHKGRNKHHFEYWIDYAIDEAQGPGMVGMKMPVNYVVESYVDRVAASKNYQKEKYRDDSAWTYYLRGRDHLVIHPRTQALLEFMLFFLAVRGEREANAYIRRRILANRKNYDAYPDLPNFDERTGRVLEISEAMLPETRAHQSGK